MANWQNGVLDPEPLLLFVQLVRAIGHNDVRMSLLIFDEDKDVLGFGVREEYLDADDVQAERLEEYPAFIHQAWQDVLNARSIPVHIRDGGQERDSGAWDVYVAGRGRQGLPPIWISVPDPNRVNVYVYVYDRQGHESQSVRVLNNLAKTGGEAGTRLE